MLSETYDVLFDLNSLSQCWIEIGAVAQNNVKTISIQCVVYTEKHFNTRYTKVQNR